MTVDLAPGSAPTPAGWGQSLADGAAGIALLHIARAQTGTAGWDAVHHMATAMTREPIHANAEHTSLYRGAPAVAYALHTAGHAAYRRALDILDDSIAGVINLRLAAAHHRIDCGDLPHAREYDLINGLTGLGAYLMHRHDDHELLRAVLVYLVRLTDPLSRPAETLPGWWTVGSPDRHRAPRWQDGHASFGMAHGITGPLALLSAAMRRAVIVPGHEHAIGTICAWLDHWRAGDQPRRTWWPEVIDRSELRTHTLTWPGPRRPSWCYGTPGIARAQQLAGIAVNDSHRTQLAEDALLGCLTDDRQLAHLTDAGLCHGWAGLAQASSRAAADARTSELGTIATAMTARLTGHLDQHGAPADPGLLEGAAGAFLVQETATPPGTTARWDSCLLLTG